MKIILKIKVGRSNPDLKKDTLKNELNWEINSFQREKNENEGESRYNEQQCFTTQTEATTPSINKKEEVRS